MLKKILLIIAVASTLLIPTVAEASFTVPSGSPYSSAVEWINQFNLNGATELGENRFITRKDFIRWILTTQGLDGDTYTAKTHFRYNDVTDKHPETGHIYYLVDNGFFGIKENQFFYPLRPIRVQEALDLIFFVQGVPTPKIIDKQSWPFGHLRPIGSFAPTFQKAAKLGLIDPEQRIFPGTPIRRGDALNLLFNAHNIDKEIIVQIITTGNGNESPLSQTENYGLLTEVFNRIQQSFIDRDSIEARNLVYGAVEGLVNELDDKHSEFTRPTDMSVLGSLSNNLEGIGAVIEAKENGDIIVLSPLRGSPAEKSGLLPNDVISAVDGESIQGLAAFDAALKIRGPAGTEVTLTIKRTNRTFDVKITRAKIHVPSAEVKFTTDNIAILNINNFGSTTDTEFTKAVLEIKEKNPRGVILDLRNNPGGFLDVATRIAGYFIKEGEMVAKIRYPTNTQFEVSSGPATLVGYRVMVLVNKGSASASEILAGALQDHKIATIIGETTYGKGTVQEVTSFTDGSTVKLTVAEWLTPNGGKINGNGVKPDISVLRTESDISAGLDPQLDRALSELR